VTPPEPPSVSVHEVVVGTKVFENAPVDPPTAEKTQPPEPVIVAELVTLKDR
jgi:hypothetical protein